MSNDEYETQASQESEGPSRAAKLWGTVRKAASTVGQVSGETLQKGAQAGKLAALGLGQTVQDATGKVQRKLGEDYYAILDQNPVVVSTMSRANLLVDNSVLLGTAFNIPWTTTLLWSAAAGSAISLSGDVAVTVKQLIHDGPKHFQRWDEINKYMDLVTGSGHRLKWGHSIDALPGIVERFGIEGVPAFFAHLIQDFTTPEGIPVVPKAWDIKQLLEGSLLRNNPKAATGLVSINFCSMLTAMAVLTLITQLWQLGDAAVRKVRINRHLKTAANAVQGRDYNAATVNYQRALEIERTPACLMALGQVYTQRASTRLRAHQAFVEAVTLLAPRPDATVPYDQAKLSLRGLASLQALSTADVLADIHPEHWNDYIQDLVNAAVFSFTSVAAKQNQESRDLVPDVLVAPAHFSAAINYYLAAKTACYYPLAEDRQETVVQNVRSALRSLGLMAQYDEEGLRHPTTTLGQLWAWEVLPPGDIETELATYI